MGPGQSYGINTPEPVGRSLSCRGCDVGDCRGVGPGASCRMLGMAGLTGCGLVRAGPAPVPPGRPALTEGPLFHLVGTGQDTELSEQTPGLSSEGMGVPDLVVLEQGCGVRAGSSKGLRKPGGS